MIASDGITLTVEPGYGEDFVLRRLGSWTDLVVRVRTATGLSSPMEILGLDDGDEPAIRVVRHDSNGYRYGNPFLIEVRNITEIVV